jgi:hypothetical protein
MSTQQETFNAAYRAAQPPDVQALLDIPNTADGSADNKRAAIAIDLAQKGRIIFVETMVLGFDPWSTMSLLKRDGYTWAPNMLQPPVRVAPGIDQQGGPGNYDPANPPAGSIKVSTDLADYPPYTPPAPVPLPPHITSYVGGLNAGNVYYAPYPDDPNVDGQTVSDPRGTFTKHVRLSPWGKMSWYTL